MCFGLCKVTCEYAHVNKVAIFLPAQVDPLLVCNDSQHGGKMDLTPVFAATLSPNPNERIQAELQLRQLESQDGLLTSVLHLVSNDTVNPGIRQAASIYFKNRIGKAWSADTEDRHAKEQNSQFIPSNFQDRQSVRDNLLPAITIASPLLKKQLTAALGTVVQNDFPEVRCALIFMDSLDIHSPHSLVLEMAAAAGCYHGRHQLI